MGRVRTRIAVTGLAEAEAVAGIPDLLDEFGHRPWLSAYDARWVADGSRLVVTVESDGDGLAVQGGTTGGHLDEVWDCVIACIRFPSEGVRFRIEESSLVPGADPPRPA